MYTYRYVYININYIDNNILDSSLLFKVKISYAVLGSCRLYYYIVLYCYCYCYCKDMLFWDLVDCITLYCIVIVIVIVKICCFSIL